MSSFHGVIFTVGVDDYNGDVDSDIYPVKSFNMTYIISNVLFHFTLNSPYSLWLSTLLKSQSSCLNPIHMKSHPAEPSVLR